MSRWTTEEIRTMYEATCDRQGIPYEPPREIMEANWELMRRKPAPKLPTRNDT